MALVIKSFYQECNMLYKNKQKNYVGYYTKNWWLQ